MDLSQQLDHRPALVTRKANLAHTLLWQGKFGEAEKLARESLAIGQELGYQEKDGGLWAHCVLCSILLHIGQYHKAGRQAEQLLGLHKETGVSLALGWLYLVLGQRALVESSYSQAQDAFAQSSEHFQPGWSTVAGFPLAGLGHAACRLGQIAPARQYLAQALESALAAKPYGTIVYILPFVAYFLATTGHLERGVELWEIARTQPFVAHSKWFADVAGLELEVLAAALPPEVVEAARERGRGLDLWATAEVLLAELEAMNSA